MNILKGIGECLFTIIRWILTIILILIVVVLLIRFIGQRIVASSFKDYPISGIYQVELDGKSQKIAVESTSKKNPILIMLHGGPGMPIPFGIGYRGVYDKLLERFTLVQWDQYGFGKNKGEIESVKDYLPMLDDLINYLKQENETDQVYIFSYSYGTIISGLYASEHPDNINGIISLGTFVSNNSFIKNYYEELQKYELTEEERTNLEQYINNNDNDSYTKTGLIARKYISDYQGENKKNNIMQRYIAHILISPDYSLIDLYNILRTDKNPNLDKLLKELDSIDMTSIYEQTTVPIYFIQGESDRLVTSKKLSELKSTNENIDYMELNNCGHVVSDGNWENVWKLISEFVNKQTKKTKS